MIKRYFKTAFRYCLILLLVSPALLAESHDAESILQAFRDSFDWTDHVSMRVQSHGSSTWKPESGSYNNFYFYNDHGTHQQTYGTTQELDSVTGEVYRYDYGPDKGRQFQTLYSPETGGYFLHEHRAIDDVPESFDIYEAGEERNRIHLIFPGMLGPVLGYVLLFSKECLPDLLSPDIVTMREEGVNGLSTVVVEATIPEGHIELWLSPEKGYAMEKCRLTKVAGKDLGYDGQVYAHSFALVDKPIQTEKTIEEINVIEHKLIEGKYVPVQMETNTVSEWEGGVTTEATHNITLSEIIMNPDEEVLRDFEFIVPEEVHTRFRTKDGKILTDFKWEEGKLVADLGETRIHENIEEVAGQENAEHMSEAEEPSTLRLNLAGTESDKGIEENKFILLYFLIPAGLILLITGWILYRRIIKKKQSPGKE